MITQDLKMKVYTMDSDKKRQLEAMGFQVGSVYDFLGSSKEEQKIIEDRIKAERKKELKKKTKSKKKSKKYLLLPVNSDAVPNICFSIADEVYQGKNHKSIQKTYFKQRIENGFDDTETWHIDRTMALFLIPRLKRFIEVNNGIANGETQESYDEKLRFIINAFENYYATDKYYNCSSKDQDTLIKDVKQAVEYLSKLWFELWW